MEDATRSSAAEDFKPENPIEEANDIYRAATEEVRGCEKVLAEAKDRLNKAGTLLVEIQPQLNLHELNRQQKKITKTENNRRFRTQEALAELKNHFNPVRKPRPPLFKQDSKE